MDGAKVRAAIDDKAVAILCRNRLDRFGHLIDYGRRNLAPALGQDTDQILIDCGFANSRIEALRRSGIIQDSPGSSI